ncbi:MAG: hypothetical protein HYZ57_14035 [Acidobacteria bacterium]|nr:hypothetical protein [Acidobacteriota bacterium]MBI3280950.1 hypothetical protein [Acidobacteriota bacterium]
MRAHPCGGVWRARWHGWMTLEGRNIIIMGASQGRRIVPKDRGFDRA